MRFSEWRSKVKYYSEITDIWPIARRYLVIGAFDGALTIMGVVLGALAGGAGPEHVNIIVFASISAAIALAVSSAVGAYEAERVEKRITQRSLERALLSSISSEHQEAYRFAVWISTIVHGMAPILAALVPLIPFFFLDFSIAAWTSISVTLLLLFFVGCFLGRLSKEEMFITGLRFVAAGLGTAIILFLLGVGH